MEKNKINKLAIVVQQEDDSLLLKLNNEKFLSLYNNGKVKTHNDSSVLPLFTNSKFIVSVNNLEQSAKIDRAGSELVINFDDCVKIEANAKGWSGYEFNFTHDRFEQLPPSKLIQTIRNVQM